MCHCCRRRRAGPHPHLRPLLDSGHPLLTLDTPSLWPPPTHPKHDLIAWWVEPCHVTASRDGGARHLRWVKCILVADWNSWAVSQQTNNWMIVWHVCEYLWKAVHWGTKKQNSFTRCSSGIVCWARGGTLQPIHGSVLSHTCSCYRLTEPIKFLHDICHVEDGGAEVFWSRESIFHQFWKLGIINLIYQYPVCQKLTLKDSIPLKIHNVKIFLRSSSSCPGSLTSNDDCSSTATTKHRWTNKPCNTCVLSLVFQALFQDFIQWVGTP